MVISSTANGNASSNTCHYRQEALDESIGACTNNLGLCIYGKGCYCEKASLLYKVCLTFCMAG